MAEHSAFGPWCKSSYSGHEANCVELARVGRTVGVRDSKLGDASPILEFSAAALAAFLDGVRSGELAAQR